MGCSAPHTLVENSSERAHDRMHRAEPVLLGSLDRVLGHSPVDGILEGLGLDAEPEHLGGVAGQRGLLLSCCVPVS